MGLQVQCMCMVKKPFTTRLDDAVLAVAQKVAESERRSVTSVIEVAILEYAERHTPAAVGGYRDRLTYEDLTGLSFYPPDEEEKGKD